MSASEDHQLEVLIYDKLDSKLSKNELHQIFLVYNECFYHNKVTASKQIILAKKWLGKSKTWHWFLAKVKGKIVGIAAYCYDYAQAVNFDIRPDRGENVCSVSVKTKFRNLGIARLLMEAIINHYSPTNDLVVEIKSANKYAKILLRFYKSLGFCDLSTEPESTFLIRYQDAPEEKDKDKVEKLIPKNN